MLICPQCKSDRIIIKNYAQRVCSLLGTMAGAVSAAAGMIRGAEMGAAGGMMIAGPGGACFGSIAGAILGGIVGGTAGGATGAKLGTFVDDHILNNYRCLSCEFAFDKKCATLHQDEGEEENEDRHDDLAYFRMHQGGYTARDPRQQYRRPSHDPHDEEDMESGFY